MSLALHLAAALGLSTAACALSGAALASALLATTPACELVSESEATGAVGRPVHLLGGVADIAHMSTCYWDAQDGGRLELTLSEEGLFSPSGQSARDYFDMIVASLAKAGEPFETLSGIGHGAVLMETAGERFISMAAGGGYLSIRLGDSTREAIIAIARIAAARM